MTTDRPLSSPARPAIPLAGLLALVMIGLCGSAYWQGGGSLETIRAIDRLMARTAAVLFSVALSASATASLFPSPLTRWLLARRRDLALAFAAAFGLHILAIAGFYRLDPKLFWSVSPPALVALRAIGVVFVVLMLVDLRRLFGPRGWAITNTIGGWYIWAAFLSGFVKRLAQDRIYLWLAALLILVPVLRFAAALRRRRAGPEPSSAP
jgi:hypothetical protein